MRYIFLLLLTTFYLFGDDITVTVIYGDERADKVIKTTYQEGDTALEVLDKVADITVAKGKYKFIRSINGKKSIPGSFGWFYTIDDKSVHKMASSYKLHKNKTMTWEYKVEDCYKVKSCN
jgi:hypothetical protein